MDAPNQPAWTITGQHPVTVPDASGKFVDAIRVDFRTHHGDSSFITVPKAQYTAGQVVAAIQQHVAELIGARSFQPPIAPGPKVS
jgi:hypothetical protein